MRKDVVKKDNAFFLQNWFRAFSNHHSRRVNDPPGIVEVIFNDFNAFDQAFASPFTNVRLIKGALGSNLLDDIYKSRYPQTCCYFLIIYGFFTILFARVISFYRALRNKEKESHIFYFRRFLLSQQGNKITMIMGESRFPYEILLAAAYFYSPDVSWIVCRMRQLFCWGNHRQEYKKLRAFLTASSAGNKIIENEILQDIFREIIEKLVIYFNEKSTKKFEYKEGNIIGFTDEYSKVFFPVKFVFRKNPPKKLSYVELALKFIGEITFIYWIVVFACTFVFPILSKLLPLICSNYLVFLMTTCVGVPVFPIAVTLLYFVVRWPFITGVFQKKGHALQNKEGVHIEEENIKKIFEKDIIELEKKRLFIEHTGLYIPCASFNTTQLYKDLQEILASRRVIKVAVAIDAFVQGCLLPFFAHWLFSDFFIVCMYLIKGIVVVGPAAPVFFNIFFMVVAAVTLLLAISYGIKKTIHAFHEHDKKFNKFEEEFQKEVRLLQNLQVPDLPLDVYERLLRRYCLKEPKWSLGKKILNRTCIFVSRLCTGSLFSRIIICGSISAFMVVPCIFTVPSVIISFIATCAVLFATAYVCIYNFEKKTKKLENILNLFFCLRMDFVRELADNNMNKIEKVQINQVSPYKLGSTFSMSEVNLSSLGYLEYAVNTVDLDSEKKSSYKSIQQTETETSKFYLPLRRVSSENILQHDGFQFLTPKTMQVHRG